jgi:hypothetical protein
MSGCAAAGLPGIGAEFDAGVDFAARIVERRPGLRHDPRASSGTVAMISAFGPRHRQVDAELPMIAVDLTP